MRILTRYILRHLFISTSITGVCLTLMIWLGQTIRLLELVIDGGAPLSVFLKLGALTFPTFLGVVLPVSLIAGIFFTYHRLIAESELVVMTGAGASPMDIAKPMLLMAGAVSIALLSLNVYISPAAQRELTRLKELARNELASVLLRPGAFNDAGSKVTVYAREKDDSGELRGLLIHDGRNAERPVTIIAERGLLVDDAEGARVIVFNGNRQDIDRNKGRLSELYFEQYTVDLRAVNADYGSRWIEPEERTLWELWKGPQNATDAQFQGRLVAEFHARLATPLFPFGFGLVAIAFLLAGDFSRRGQTKKILSGIVVIVILQAMAIGATNLLTRTPAAAILLYAVVIVPVVGGLWSLKGSPASSLRSGG